jgi:uncharacterized RDD family membrane protein YckC
MTRKNKKNQNLHKNKVTANDEGFPRAGFFRRFAAMIYDALVATAVWMLASIVITTILTVLLENGVLPKNGYEHVNELIQDSVLYKSVIQAWTIAWVIGFFLWFWKNGGQTLGMRAWRLKIFNLKDEVGISYGRLFLRLITALGGLGTLLVLLDYKNKQSLQDRIANTEVLFLSKEANDHKSW